MSQFAASVICTTLLVATSLAQTPDWTQITTANTPSARNQHGMAYDSVRGKVVLFGGYASGRLNDTWE